MAKKLNFDFIDTDYEIVVGATNYTIIFEQDGENILEKLESIILEKFIKEDVVIITGGGIITNKEKL